MTSSSLSEYDVISNFSPLVPSKMRFFRNFFIPQPIKLKFGTGIQNWMLILFFLPQKVAKGRFQTIWHKTHFFTSLSGQTPLRNSIAMATSKIPVDQQLFERMWYMLKLKVTKFQLSTPNDFWAVLKNSGGGVRIQPFQNGVKTSHGVKTSLYNDAEGDKFKCLA